MAISRTAQAQRVLVLTKDFIGIRSVSPSVGETRMAMRIKGYFDHLGIRTGYLKMNDGRKNVYVFLPGSGETTETLLMFGHIDTVGTGDYGKLEGLATNPDALRKAIIKEGTEDRAISDLKTGDWLCGRGSLDMKSGVAIEMDVISRIQRRPVRGNIIFLGTPDEENDSAGILQAIPHLREFVRTQSLNLIGAINADYTTERFVGDPARYLYVGTIGKLLPSFLIVGKETHVGEAYSGMDANLIAAELVRQIELNTRLCDTEGGETTLPPVTLKMRDLKGLYNVQTPFMAWVYFNLFTHSRTPAEVMQLMSQQAREAAASASTRLRESRAAYKQAYGQPPGGQDLEVKVLNFAELKDNMEIDPRVTDAETDPREKSRLIVEDLWRRSGRNGPAIIAFLSPPYYPHGYVDAKEESESAFVRFSRSVAGKYGLEVRNFYPYISDNSFLRVTAAGTTYLRPLMPLWGNGYSLPMDDIAALNLPVVNIGPWGMDAHKRTERVFAPYSFGKVPQIMEEIIRMTLEQPFVASGKGSIL